MFKKSVFAVSALVSSVGLAQSPDMKSKSAPSVPPAMEKPNTVGTVESHGSIKMAKVFFLEPKDGATVSKKFKMKFANEGGLKVLPAGDITPGTGHYHVIVDGGPVAEGVVVPTDEKNIHYGKGQTEAELTLKPGQHKLTLQFADGAHRSYGPILSQTITVTVK